MSYVPDYVRGSRVEQNSIISTGLTNTTASYTTSRPVSTNTFTSTAMPSTILTSPPNSSRDVTPTSPSLYYQRPQTRNTSYVGYREDYFRKREEKLCGRKSLKERLKSLESGADVKLQVSKGAQYRRRRSSDRLNVNDSNNSNKSQKTLPEPPISVPPDIIESHQPPAGDMHYNSLDTNINEEIFYTNNNEPLKTNFNDYHLPEKNHKDLVTNTEPTIVVKWNQEQNIQPKNKETDPKKDKDVNSNVEPIKTVLKSEKERSTETKLKWREPSIEALNRLHEYVDDQNNYNFENKNETEVQTEDKAEVQETATPPMRTPDPPPKRSAPPPLMLDVTTSQSVVVPVELRSPRSESKGFSRSNMREKRSARMFVMPSSDDSESDIQFSRLNQDNTQKLIHVTPVKFVPSVLRRKKPPNPASSSSSYDSVSQPKVNEDVTKETSQRKPATHQPKEPARQKKPSSRNQSSQMVNNHDRTPDVNSHYSKSPQPKKRSNPKRRSSSERSHNAHTPSKYNDEYAELSNKPRTPQTPRGTRKLPTENLPSPRQVAVGQAVKFGYPVDEGEIPYIDGMHSPEQPKKNIADDPTPKSSPAKHVNRRGRTNRRDHSPSRTTSYIEAIESSEDLTADTDGSLNSGALNGPDNIQSLPNISKFGRSNSADSILSTTEDLHKKVIMRKHKRSSSADRNSLKGVHRRSYQIATSPYSAAVHKNRQNTQQLTTPDSGFKRQRSMRKLKNFFGETSPHVAEAQEVRGRTIAPLPTLDLSCQEENVLREGFLYFKVATIEKGKRTSAQKLWKYVWVVLRDHFLYLCKDWLRAKQDPTVDHQTPPNNPSSQHPQHPPLKHVLEDESPLDVRRSLVSIAYNYVKRRDVFRLTTSNGSEYLFQADSRDDMLAWINSIQFESNPENDQVNEDLILRKTNQFEAGPRPDKRNTRKSRSPKAPRQVSMAIKDVDGSRRFKWRGSVNRIVRKFGQGQTLMQGGTFDVHLEDCPISPNNEFVPFVVELCCRILEEKGLFFKGIYRVPGNSGTLAALQDELNLRGPDAVDLENDERFSDVNVVSSLLKSFFRKLPDPLFTNELYDDFITTNRKKESDERLNGLRRLIHMLPGPHYETLKFIITHLRKVADNCEINMMDVRNLAIVFGPNLVRTSASDNMATMVTDMSDQCEIVQSVLQHASWYFADENDKWLQNISNPPQQLVEHEAVPNIDHLLANVGRTRPLDNSDNASDSSKSKNSITSEKESFSRDVMEMIFGAKRKKAKQDKMLEEEQESEDEFGFKEASLKAAIQEEPTKDSATKYQVAKPAATGIRANWPNNEQAVDIPARLHQFYCEHLDKLSKKEEVRLPRFSSSSDTSPRITPRTSKHEPSVTYKPSSQPAYTPRNFKNKQFSPAAPRHSTPVSNTDNNIDKGEESDSDMSVYIGETLEEKLKNLTNLDKKLERRPSQRYRQREPAHLADYNQILNKPQQASHVSTTGAKRLTGPSKKAGVIITPDNVDIINPKKSTMELYHERKALRKQFREQSKHRANTAKNRDTRPSMTRCASHENIFQRSDPKRKAIPTSQHVESKNPSVHLKPKTRVSKDRVLRRHTLGAGDFLAPELWQNNTDQQFVPKILVKKTESYL